MKEFLESIIVYLILGVFFAIVILPVVYYTQYIPCKKHFPNEAIICVLSTKYRITEGVKQ